jgi:hypothetical protein
VLGYFFKKHQLDWRFIGWPQYNHIGDYSKERRTGKHSLLWAKVSNLYEKHEKVYSIYLLSWVNNLTPQSPTLGGILD